VLDMDETLIHYNHDADSSVCDDEFGGELLVRPGALEFLQEMSQAYELVIWTAATQDYADWVLDKIDTEGLISHRLYRQHVSSLPDHGYIKDLHLMGRSLAKTLIVDNRSANFENLP